MKWRHRAMLALTAGAVAIAPLNSAEAATFGKPVATYFGSTPTFGPLVNALCSGLVFLTSASGTPIDTSYATPVTKTITRSDNGDGSSDFMIVISGPIPPAFTTIDVLDCVWIDTNNDGVQQIPAEPMRSYRKLGVAIAGSGANRTVTFELNVPAAVGKSVCDRAFGVSWSTMQSVLTNQSGLVSGSWMAMYSPKVCSSPTPPPDIPEVSSSVLLTLTGIGTAGAFMMFQQRRRRVAL
jgi:hypothetical protein